MAGVASFVAATAVLALAPQDAVPPPAAPPRAAMDPVSAALLFPKEREIAEAEFAGLPREEVRFENASGLLLRGLWHESDASDRTVLVCGGNTGNATYFEPFAALLHAGGYDVLTFDWQGFGKSEGTAALLSLPGDVQAAWRWLGEVKQRKPDQVGVLGISLGSVLALQLAADVQPAACAVEDLFFPDEQLAAGAGGGASAAERVAIAALQALVVPQVDPRRNAARYRGPLFLLHGTDDWLLTPMATVRLLESRRESTRGWLMGATGHSPDSLQVDEWEFRDQLLRFFGDAFSGRPLAEPRAAFTVVPGAATAATRVRVDVEAPRAALVEVALVRPRENAAALDAWVERRAVPEGASSFECETPFVPLHVVAIERLHGVPRGDGSFEPELSPLSQSLHDFAELQADWERQPRTVEIAMKWRAHDGSERRSTRNARGVEAWRWLQRRLPDWEEVDPRVRPRYALLLAQFADGLEAVERIGGWEALPEVRRALIDFLPPEPRSFVTLGNATIDVGFAPRVVEEQLAALWFQQTFEGDLAAARQTWQLLRRFEPLDEATALPAAPRADAPR